MLSKNWLVCWVSRSSVVMSLTLITLVGCSFIMLIIISLIIMMCYAVSKSPRRIILNIKKIQPNFFHRWAEEWKLYDWWKPDRLLKCLIHLDNSQSQRTGDNDLNMLFFNFVFIFYCLRCMIRKIRNIYIFTRNPIGPEIHISL